MHIQYVFTIHHGKYQCANNIKCMDHENLCPLVPVFTDLHLAPHARAATVGNYFCWGIRDRPNIFLANVRNLMKMKLGIRAVR